MTLDEIIDDHFKHANAMIMQCGANETLLPSFCGYTDDAPVFAMMSQFDSPDHGVLSKNMAATVCRGLLQKGNCTAYSIATETWFARIAIQPGEKNPLSYDGPPPSERSDRQEGLLIYAEKENQVKVGMWIITRSDDGRVKTLTRQENMPGEMFQSLRFGGLLKNAPVN